MSTILERRFAVTRSTSPSTRRSLGHVLVQREHEAAVRPRGSVVHVRFLRRAVLVSGVDVVLQLGGFRNFDVGEASELLVRGHGYWVLDESLSTATFPS